MAAICGHPVITIWVIALQGNYLSLFFYFRDVYCKFLKIIGFRIEEVNGFIAGIDPYFRLRIFKNSPHVIGTNAIVSFVTWSPNDLLNIKFIIVVVQHKMSATDIGIKNKGFYVVPRSVFQCIGLN